MRLFLLTSATFALFGPKDLQIAFAITCVIGVPLWINNRIEAHREKAIPCSKTHSKRMPDMEYLYDNNSKSKPYC